MTPRFDVTVCVPTYQGADHLDDCLSSIASQDLDGVEVLVVDDASTDGTVAVTESYSDRLGDLRVVRNERRRGAAANANRCIELARGAWIKPVFQDDLIAPGSLARMRAARRRGVPVVVCARTYLYEAGVPEQRRAACDHLLAAALDQRFGGGSVGRDRIAEILVAMAEQRTPQLNFIGEPVATLFERRAALRHGAFDTGYVQLWDYELMLRLGLRRGIEVVEDRLATFRVHEQSETARNLSGSTFRADVGDRLRLHIAYATGKGYRRARRVALRREPPVDLTALAVGVSWAALELLEDLPTDERQHAAPAVEALTGRLPPTLVGPSHWAASETADALLWEMSPERAAARVRAHEQAPDRGPGASDAGVGVDPSGPDVAISRSGPATAVGRVARGLRTSQWWGHMLGPVVAFAYLQLGWRQVPPGVGIPRVLALVGSAVALAGYGYVVNDTCDVVPDRRAGKANAMARYRFHTRAAIIVGFAAVGLVPWVFLHLEGPARLALGGIYLLPLLYSAPPIRLKERHLLGPLADASNAFVLPALFTIALFAPMGSTTGPAPLMVVGGVLWASGFGLRAIIKHQVDDDANDRDSGTRTLVGQVGVARARWVVRWVLFPTELLGLVLLTVTVLTWSWPTVAAGIGCATLFHGLRLTGGIDRRLATSTLEHGWWLYWYQIWPALLLSLGLAAWDPWYLLLVAWWLVLFWRRIRSAGEVIRQSLATERHRHRAVRQT